MIRDIGIPITIFQAQHDITVHNSDVAELINKLGQAVEHVEYSIGGHWSFFVDKEPSYLDEMMR